MFNCAQSSWNPPPGLDSAAIFPLQQVVSAFCKDHAEKFDCIQPGSGAGYYVVPAGDIALVGPDPQSYHVSISINTVQGFFAPGGTEVWQAEAAFEWLLGAAFGP